MVYDLDYLENLTVFWIHLFTNYVCSPWTFTPVWFIVGFTVIWFQLDGFYYLVSQTSLLSRKALFKVGPLVCSPEMTML